MKKNCPSQFFCLIDGFFFMTQSEKIKIGFVQFVQFKAKQKVENIKSRILNLVLSTLSERPSHIACYTVQSIRLK